MKFKIPYLLLTLVAMCALYFSCSRKKVRVDKIIPLSATYRLSKIDSINNYYLIYAKKRDRIYKIVSTKEEALHCEKVQLNNTYDLPLVSIWNKDIFIDGVNISPSILPGLGCLYFDEHTKICLEGDSIRDLFNTRNLKGLCWVK